MTPGESPLALDITAWGQAVSSLVGCRHSTGALICLHFSWEKSHLFSHSGVAWRSFTDIPILSGTCSFRGAQRLLGARDGRKEMLQNLIISLHIDEWSLTGFFGYPILY